VSRWIIAIAAFLSVLTACGGGSGSPPNIPTPTPGNTVAIYFPAAFDTTLVGNTDITFANIGPSGTVPVTITSETLSGADAQYFTSTSNCSKAGPISVSAACSETLTFTPTTARFYSASLTFVDSAIGSRHVLSIAATATATPPAVDCSAATNLCPTVSIQGDPIAAGLFHGYADPAVRAGSSNIFLAYGWPHTLSDGTHVVDIHLAEAPLSLSPGAVVTNYSYVGPLYQSTTSTQTVTNAYASTNDTSAETIDLIEFVPPADIVAGVVTAETWVQAHVSYLVKPQADIYAQLTPTSVISVSALQLMPPSASNAGTTLLGIATAPEARLGAAGTDASRNVTQNLSSLSSASKNCVSFSHPALWYSYFGTGTLYLALECVEDPGSTDAHQYSHFLYSTTPTGFDASKWTWAYVDEFATPAEAVQLATAEGASYTFFTGMKFAITHVNNSLKDRLLMIVSPATLAPAGAVQPIIQYGCRALLSGNINQIGTYLLNSPAVSSFLVDANGAPLDSGKVTESDLYTGANEGPASCTFDYNAGMMMNRKYEADPTQGFYTYPVSTGLTPNTFK